MLGVVVQLSSRPTLSALQRHPGSCSSAFAAFGSERTWAEGERGRVARLPMKKQSPGKFLLSRRSCAFLPCVQDCPRHFTSVKTVKPPNSCPLTSVIITPFYRWGN